MRLSSACLAENTASAARMSSTVVGGAPSLSASAALQHNNTRYSSQNNNTRYSSYMAVATGDSVRVCKCYSGTQLVCVRVIVGLS